MERTPSGVATGPGVPEPQKPISGKRTKGGAKDIEPIAQHGINTWSGDGVPLFA
jgi:hypothetical protein